MNSFPQHTLCLMIKSVKTRNIKGGVFSGGVPSAAQPAPLSVSVYCVFLRSWLGFVSVPVASLLLCFGSRDQSLRHLRFSHRVSKLSAYGKISVII